MRFFFGTPLKARTSFRSPQIIFSVWIISRVCQKQRRIASAQHTKEWNRIIQFDEKFLSSPRSSPPAAPTALRKSKRLTSRAGRIARDINLTQPSKIGFYLATIKKGRRTQAHRSQEKFPRYNTFVCRFSSLLFFLVLKPPVHPPVCGTTWPSSQKQWMRRWMKRLLGNIAAGSFSRALHEWAGV